ncbi:MAG TPA: sulfotransferase [Rhodanobacteraceae bacterium]|nr:sulfotransferase [Rhodanobacteraceae bacterium]
MTGCILVFGMPRSGTTWIGKLFDSHPDTLYRHEPDSVRRLSMSLFPEKEDAGRYRGELEGFVASLPYVRSSKVVCKQPLFSKDYQSTASLYVYRASAAAARIASRFQKNFPCLYRPTAEGCGRARLVWKSIESSGRLGICIAALPEAHAIHVMRHPCGVVASWLRGAQADGFGRPTKSAGLWMLKPLLATTTGKARGIDLEDIQRLTPEEQLTWGWVLMQEKILADVAGCERVLTVRYEDVCADPLATTRKMFEFTGLDWQSQTEAFVRASTQSTAHVTDSDYYSVFKPPQESAERWRTELTPDVIQRVLEIVSNSPLHHYYPEEAPAQARAPVAEVAK